MDYSAVSQAAKRFEQKSKDNHKIGEIKQKMMAAFFRLSEFADLKKENIQWQEK